MTNIIEESLMTTAEVAAHLAVPESFVRRLVRERRIEFVKVGRYVRFESNALQLFVERGRRS